MSWHPFRLAAALVALAILAPWLRAAETAPPDPVVVATGLLDALIAGKPEVAASRFDATMKDALPVDALAQTWAGLSAQVGALLRRGTPRTLDVEDVRVVLIELAFERATLDLRVPVRPATGEIAGLFFAPPSGEGTPVTADAAEPAVAIEQAVDGEPPPDPVPADEAVPPDTLADERPVVVKVIAPEPQAVVGALLADIEAGEYAAAVGRFDASLSGMVTAELLKQGWTDVRVRLGELRERGAWEQQVVGESTHLGRRLVFERGAVDLQASVLTATGGVTGFVFSPVAAEAAPPPSDAPFTEAETTVGEGGGALGATLTMPRGEGPFPCVVLVHGSGPHDRDETIGPNKPFRDIAWGLAERGVASLRYDKRTKAHGAAMAGLATTLTVDDEVVRDAALAVRVAARAAGVDAGRVVLAGHSLGGMLAPRIAARTPGLAGVAFLATPAQRLEDAVLMQMEYIARLDGDFSEADARGIADLKKQVALVKSAELTPETPAMLLPLGMPAAYWLSLRDVDPVAEARTLPLPMLFVQGGRDYQVTMRDLEAFRAALRGRKDVRFVVRPELNHLFIAGEAKGAPMDYLVPGTVAPEVVDAIAAFATRPGG